MSLEEFGKFFNRLLHRQIILEQIFLYRTRQYPQLIDNYQKIK